MKSLKFILFLYCIFSFSQSTELYIAHDGIITGFDASNISCLSSKRNTPKQIFVKDNTIFYSYKSSLYAYELINLITNEDNLNKNYAFKKTTIKKPLTIIVNKKINNHVFKSLPLSAYFSLFSKNRFFNAVNSNLSKYKNIKKDLLFSTLTNSLFINLKKSNRLTVSYINISRSYLLVSYYTSRPPPLVV